MPRCEVYNPLHCSLVLFSQPLWELNSGAVGQGYREVLLRLRSPDGNIHPPASLLSMAGSVKRMFSVDRIVITLLFEYLQQNPNDQRRYGINLSADTIAQNGKFFAFLIKELQIRGVDPKRLVFEINEHTTNTNRESLIEWIRYLESMGSCFALDDFGVGETNFLTIKSLIAKASCYIPPCRNFVKIDCSFVRHLDREDNWIIVKAIADLCRVSNALSIAECVDTLEQYRQLRSVGVDFAQGFFSFAAQSIDGKPQLLYEPKTPVYVSLIEQE